MDIVVNCRRHGDPWVSCSKLICLQRNLNTLVLYSRVFFYSAPATTAWFSSAAFQVTSGRLLLAVICCCCFDGDAVPVRNGDSHRAAQYILRIEEGSGMRGLIIVLFHLISGCRMLCCFEGPIINRGVGGSRGICFERHANAADVSPNCFDGVVITDRIVTKRFDNWCSTRSCHRRQKKSGLKRATFMGSRFTGVLVTSA